MQLTHTILLLLSALSAANAVSWPHGRPEEFTPMQALHKRKGGGSRGGGSSSGGGGRPGGGTGTRGGTSPTTNTGGFSSSGSGPRPSLGGGKYYHGGATVPFQAGRATRSGLLPLALVGGGLLVWSSLWLPGAYLYHYNHPYTFNNNSVNPPQRQSLPVNCVCQPDTVCGCDDTGDYAWLDDVIPNGSVKDLNQSIAFVDVVNGTKSIYINGTLPNGTTAPDGSDQSSGAVHLDAMSSMAGFWPAVLTIGAIFML